MPASCGRRPNERGGQRGKRETGDLVYAVGHPKSFELADCIDLIQQNLLLDNKRKVSQTDTYRE